MNQTNEFSPFSDDLLDVILKDKPMGYLPLGTVKNARISLEKTQKLCKQHKISFKIFKPDECMIMGGAVVCWSEEKVQNILDKYQEILMKDKIPTQANEYVDYVLKNWIAEKTFPNSYKICGYIYGDKSFIPLILE